MSNRNRAPRPGARDVFARPRPYLRRIAGEARERYRDPSTRSGTLALLVLGILLIGGLGYWIKFASGVPSVADLRDVRRVEASIVYTVDGQELTRYHDKNRTWVPLDSISQQVVHALIATEDHRFYRHWGIDVRRTFSSLWKTAQGDRQGGSTITMQLARNAFDELSDDPAVVRKLKEYISALQIETLYSKDEILEMYLNSVPFMYGTFGIEAAARTYFQKAAVDLGLLEAATLIGMLKGTVMYNPVRNPEASHERRNVVLAQMAKRGYLDQADVQDLADQPTALDFRRMTHEENLAPHFAEHLRLWLDDWADQRGYNLYLDGLRIHTAIDSRLQTAAQEAVSSVGANLQAVADVEWSASSPRFFSSSASAYASVAEGVEPFSHFWSRNQEVLDQLVRQSPEYRRLTEGGVAEDSALVKVSQDAGVVDSLKQAYQRLEASFVAIDPANGHIRAWAGGRDFAENKYDHVSQAKRQPGSTFKPFVYAAALDHGFSPEDYVRDEVVTHVDPHTGKRWSPRNVGSVSGQPIKLRDALAYSKNTITARLMMELGASRVAQYAHRMGIESELQEYPSLGLGTSEVTLLEMATAYGTIASGGTYHEPVMVLRIEDRHGRTLAQFAGESRGSLNASTSYTLLDMMRGVVDRGTGRRMRSVFGARGDLAGKTGTTQDGADGWFMLMHPDLVMGSWVGFASPHLAFRSDYWGQGSHNALYVVGEFYTNSDLPADARFSPPPGYRTPVSSGFRLASDGEFGYDDSLSVDSYELADSLARYDYEWSDSAGAGDYNQNVWRDVDDLQAQGDSEFEMPEDGREGAGEPPPSAGAEADDEQDTEGMSEADRLTRQEREQNDVDEVLDQIQN